MILLGLTALTCTRDLESPGRVARIMVVPRFDVGAAPAGNALGIDQIHAQVQRHSTQDLVFDKTYPFATGSTLQLGITLSLQQPTDTFDVTLDYERGTEVLFSGSQPVVVGTGGAGVPVPVPVSYVGPGRSATSMTIAPRDTLLSSGDQLQFRVTVLDTATPDSLYVGWASSSASQPVDASGHLVAAIVRGTVTIRVTSPTPPGLQDSTTVRIVPKPAALVKVSGDGQSGPSGAALAQPLIVQVNGSDALGVPGVTVVFAAATGGGAVDSTAVATDSLGRAATTAKLGPGPGPQTFTATAGAFSVTFSATAAVAPAKIWTGAVSTDWATAGNWTPAGVPQATDSVVIPSGTANAAVIRGGASYSVDGLFIQSGASVTIDTASLFVFGSFTQAGTFTDPTASSALLLQGTGKALAGSIPILATTVTGSYTLTGNVQAATLQVSGGALTLGGHTLTMSSAFTTSGTGVITMATPVDSLVVQGNAAFAGGVETGHLTAGTFVLGGSFAVTTTSAFDAGPGHLTVFNGAAAQNVFVFDTTHSNQFGSVEFRNPTGVIFGQLTGINGNAKLDSNAVVTSTDTTYTGGGMAMNGGLTTLPGSLLKLGELWVNTTFSAAGTYAVTSTIFTGNGQAVPAGVNFPFVYILGNVSLGTGVTVGTQLAVQGGTLTLSGNDTVSGNVFTQYAGSLVLNGHSLTVGGTFTANNSGVLKMTNAADTLLIAGNAFFQGGNESGLLTAGGIVFQGSFTEGGGDPQAFAPSGTHTDAFENGGGAQTVTFGHPGGAGASHFYGLVIGNPQGALSIASDVYLMGPYAYLAGSPKIVHGGGQVVHYASMNITGVTFDNVAIAYDAGLGGANLIALDSLTFENYSINSSTPLITIVSPGNSLGGPFTFGAMSFLTSIGANAGTGNYLSVTNTGAAGALVVNITSNLTAAEGAAHTITSGSPTVTWQ